MITTYTVTGMTCGHCVAHVTEEVSALPGVDQVTVELSGAMQVTSEQEIDFAAIAGAVAEAGDYRVVKA